LKQTERGRGHPFSPQVDGIGPGLEFQRLKLKIIFAGTLLVLTGSLVLIISILSGGSFFLALVMLAGFGAFYAYETKKEFRKLSANPPLEDPEIRGMVRELSRKAGIPEPEVLTENEPVINAYALSTPGKSYVILPQGIIDSFERGEITRENLEAILAHEIAHIINKDSFIKTGMLFTVRVLQIIYNTLARIEPYLDYITQRSAEASKRYWRSGDEIAGWTMLGIAFLLLIILGVLILSSISLLILIFICMFSINFLGRQQEYVADLISARLTRKPLALAEALHNIHKLDLTGLSELPPLETAILESSTTELKDIKLSLWERLQEYNSTHPNLVNRLKMLLTPQRGVLAERLARMKVNRLKLRSLPLRELPVFKIAGVRIPLSHPVCQGILLGVLAGIISMGAGSLTPWYLPVLASAIWIGRFSLSTPTFMDNMMTLVFTSALTHSLFTTIASGVLEFYSTLALDTATMTPISILTAITASRLEKL